MFFFFKAKDGIRSLVRSRGLVDVYKRQALGETDFLELINTDTQKMRLGAILGGVIQHCPVSYTHLMLPTLYSV